MPSANDLKTLSTMMKNIKKVRDFEPQEVRPLFPVDRVIERLKEKFPFITDATLSESVRVNEEILLKCENLELEFTPQIPEIKYEDNPSLKDKDVFEKLESFVNKVDSDDRYSGFRELVSGSKALESALASIIFYGKIDLSNGVYVDRLMSEIKDIEFNGRLELVDYFLFLEDSYRYLKSKNLMRGNGRGSAAGSLFAYGLNITDVDPIKWGLMWSRFYTPDRVGTLNFKFKQLS